MSDCHSAVLLDRRATVAWWCGPRFDSPAAFGRLLDRSYVEDSLVLRTVFRSELGDVAVTDALAFAPGARGHDLGLASPHVLIRRVEGLARQVTMETEVRPRIEYGRPSASTRVP